MALDRQVPKRHPQFWRRGNAGTIAKATPRGPILTGVIPGRNYAFVTLFHGYEEDHRIVALPYWLNDGVEARVHEVSQSLPYLQQRLLAFEATL